MRGRCGNGGVAQGGGRLQQQLRRIMKFLFAFYI